MRAAREQHAKLGKQFFRYPSQGTTPTMSGSTRGSARWPSCGQHVQDEVVKDVKLNSGRREPDSMFVAVLRFAPKCKPPRVGWDVVGLHAAVQQGLVEFPFNIAQPAEGQIPGRVEWISLQ